MSGKEFPVQLSIKAVDKGALAKLRAFATAMRKIDTEKLKKTGSVLGGFSKSIGFPKLIEGFTGFGGAVKNVAGEAFSLGAKLVGMASVAGFALFTIVHGAVEAGDKLAELSDRAKVGVDWFSSMRFAAEQADVEQDAFNGSIDKFVKNMGEMKAGGGKLLSFLDKVAPKLANQVKHAKGTEDAFAIMTDAFKRIDDPMKLAALGAATFGKEAGPAMANFLHQGSAAIQGQQLEFLRLAGSQEGFARSAGELDNAMRETETAFLGLRSAAASALFPAFTKLSRAVTEFIVQNRDGIAKWANGAAAAITAWVSGGGIDRLVQGLRSVAAVVSNALDLIGGFKGAMIAIGVVMAGPLIASIAALVPAIYGLGVALLTTPVGWFVGAIGLIAGAAILIVKNWEPVKKLFSDLFPQQAQSIRDTIQGLKDLIELYQRFRKWQETPVLNSDGKPLGESFRKMLPSWIGKPEQNAKPAATWGSMYQGYKDFMATPLLGGAPGGPAAAARPAAPAGGDARVTVDFKNAPPGTVVRQDRTAAPVGLSVGYANP